MKIYRNPPEIHPPTGYSHQIEIHGAKRILILSGQIGRRKDGTTPEKPLEQLKIALENLQLNLEAAGMGLQDVVKLTYYLVGEMDNQERRIIMSEILGEKPPCSTLVYVAALALPGLKVELDAWAIRNETA
jgi:enamine deaminase RidA (YjgF/YER057c/UK114 family)